MDLAAVVEHILLGRKGAHAVPEQEERFIGVFVPGDAAEPVHVLYEKIEPACAEIPELFRGPVLSFWQAAGLLILSRILFGGFKGHHGGHRRWRHRMWRDHWENLTPEERAQLREKFRVKCGWNSTPQDAPKL